MANLGGFNPETVPEGESFDPVPVGRYELEVVESDLVEAKSGRGDILKLKHRIASGPCEGRLIFTQHNFRHENATAQEIGQREIKHLCAAIGHAGPLEDSAELHGIPFLAQVGIEQDKAGAYAPKNKITRFFPRGGEAPAPAAQRAAAPAQRNAPPAAGGQRPGWMNRAGAGAR